MFTSFLNNSATVLPYLSLLILLILTSLLAIKLFKNIFAFLASIGFAFLPFNSGELIWNNIIRGEVIDDFFDEIVYVGHSNSMSLDLSAAENLVFGIALSGISVTIDQTRIALGKFGLGKIGGKPIHTLSQGQKRRVCLTKLLFMSSKPLWILDEPFNGLDADSVDQFVKYFDEHLQNGGIIVYSTHSNVNFANPVRNLVL